MYLLINIIKYSNGGETKIYNNNGTIVMIDYGICNFDNIDRANFINYYDITNVQNYYMKKYNKLYRFCEVDIKDIENCLSENCCDINFDKITTYDRNVFADASPLEYEFEEDFIKAYGNSSVKYLQKEYSIVDNQSNVFFLDYVIMRNDGMIAVETNGRNFHHPQVIGKQKYEKQLYKQNLCTSLGIKIYRFSGEDLRFKDQLVDSIREYLGDIKDFREVGTKAYKNVELYNHQVKDLNEIVKRRSNGIKSLLIVEPTASGKSRIAEQDIIRFSENNKNFRACVIVPTIDIKNDWVVRKSKNVDLKKLNIDVYTYQYLLRNYYNIDSNKYDYIVVDEAHHFVAPYLKRMIQYFNPKFLLGMTATDERLDGKKLEEVFGTYNTSLSMHDAMKQKIIAEAHVYRIESNIDLSQVRIDGKDYVNADLESKISITSRNELIAKVINEYFTEEEMQEKQGLVFCVNVSHARKMSRILNDYGIEASDYTSKTENKDKILENFRNKKIRFLCVCNMLNEGWDYPELEIVVMARPTLSKVLYVQQLGRGLRRTKNKENVFVIDVVDQYGSMIKPYTINALFKNPFYTAFGSILDREWKVGDIIEVNGLVENIKKVVEIDINTFEEICGDYLNEENLAREYFVNTNTIKSWIKKQRIIPSKVFTFGSKNINLFSPEDVNKYKKELCIKEHNEDTIKEDFFEFLDKKDYTFSYKIIFLLSFLKNMDCVGHAKIENVLKDYMNFYAERIKENKKVDKKGCPYNSELIKDKTYMQKSMLENPFEKFERKRFMYYNPEKDMNVIMFNAVLHDKLDDNDIEKIKNMMQNDLINYYEGL